MLRSSWADRLILLSFATRRISTGTAPNASDLVPHVRERALSVSSQRVAKHAPEFLGRQVDLAVLRDSENLHRHRAKCVRSGSARAGESLERQLPASCQACSGVPGPTG